MSDQCGVDVHWWDGEYDGNCERPVGHDGPHFDGSSWFDDEGDPADEPEDSA